MIKKFLTLIFIFLLSLFFAQEEQEKIICFDCHSDKLLTKTDELTKNLFINQVKFKNSVHKNLSCTDCHSPEFEEIPHNKNIEKVGMTCIDCHGQGEIFRFETIQGQLKKSIHFEKIGKNFNCSVCHNIHSFYISTRNTSDIKATVKYNNLFCIKCHQKKLEESSHSFLPHKKRHWQSVRCIDCHAKAGDKMVSHFIDKKENAVRTCKECHSANSILLQTLYQFQTEKERHKKGFFNSVILNNSYVIGATRNYYFNIISIILSGFVIISIMLHLFIRVKFQKRSLDDKK